MAGVDPAPVAVQLLTERDVDVMDAVADDVFDGPVRDDLLRELLKDPRHHIAVAVSGGVVVGMATAVHYVHPDKPTELWINEVGVAPLHRGAGVGGRLVEALLEHGRSLGSREAWVLADSDNEAARALYLRHGARPARTTSVVYSWLLDAGRRS